MTNQLFDELERHKPLFFGRNFAKNYNTYFKHRQDVKEKLINRLQLSTAQINNRLAGRTKPSPAENEVANSLLWPVLKELFVEFIQDQESETEINKLKEPAL